MTEEAMLYKCAPASVKKYVHFSESLPPESLGCKIQNVHVYRSSPNCMSYHAIAAFLIVGETAFSSSSAVTQHLILCNGHCLL